MKKLIFICLLLVSMSALAALNPILPQNFTTNAGPLQAGSGVTFVTNADKTITISSSGGGSGIATLNGLGTNTTIYSPDDGVFHTGLTLWSAPGNINSENLDLLSSGAASGSIIHIVNNGGKGVDFGLWSDGFGAPFTGRLHFDLYNITNINLPGPGFSVGAAGKSTIVPDSGVSDHLFIVMNPTNGTTDLMKWQADNRFGISGFHFDPLKGIQEFTAGATNIFTGPGTVTGASRTVTGVNTKFLTQAPIGSLIYDGSGNGGIVTAIASDLSLTVAAPISISAGSAYTIQRPTATFNDGNGSSNLWVTANGSIYSIGGAIGGGSEPLIWKDGTQIWGIAHGGSQLNIFNHTLFANPFYINDSAPDSSVGIVASGSLSLAQGFKASGASTNLGALTVQGNILPEAVGPSAIPWVNSSTQMVALTVGSGLALSGGGTLSATGGGGGTNMVPVALSFSGGTNVAIVGTLPTGAIGEINYNLTLTNNAYLQVPSGTPVDGQKMIITATMDAVGTWNYLHDTNSAGGYKGGIDLALPLPITTNATFTDIIGYRYNLAKNKWLVTSHVRGY